MRRPALCVSLLFGLGTVLASGCSSGTPAPTAAENGYTGPPVIVESSGDGHVLVLTAPTAGWTFSLDEVRDRMEGKDVFVTVRRPNPAYLHAQAQVEQHLATQVAASEPIDVFARVLDHDDKGSRLVYYLAAQAP